MRLTPLALFLSISMIFASGCRSYGGYGSEDVMYQQTERMVQRFAEDLDRARGDLAALEQSASEDSRLTVLVERFALLIEGQEAVLNEQQSLLADLSPGSTYRSLHRAHGAIMAAQRTIRLQRAGLLRDYSSAVAGDTLSQAYSDRPYALIPPYYDRLRGQGNINAANVVSRARAAGASLVGSNAETGPSQPATDAGEAQDVEEETADVEEETVDVDSDTAAEADG